MGSPEASRKSLEYRNACTALIKITEYASGKILPDTVRYSWNTLMDAITVTDDHLDALPDSTQREGFSRTTVDLLNDTSSTALDPNFFSPLFSLRNELDKLPPDSKSSFLQTLRSIFRVTEQMRHTTSPEIYSELVRLEGQMTSRLFYTFLPSTPDFQGNRRLFKQLTRLGRAGNSLDAGIDLQDDSIRGVVSLSPTPQNKVKIISSSLGDFFGCLGAIPLRLIFHHGRKQTQALFLKPIR